MRVTTRFRRLVEAPQILVLPGVHDALGVRLAERAGFSALTAGGFGASATLLGRPDSSQLGMTEMAEYYSRLVDATELPLFADADTGYGNVTNVARTVRAYEKAGVAGLFIEDQVFPKRCGHMAGKAVVPLADFIAKLKAALDARVDSDLVIMARTDARAVNGLDDAIERMQVARAAGADMTFVEAPVSVAEMRRICAEIDAPCLANNVEGGLTPVLPAPELQAIGYAAAVYTLGATFAVAKALQDVYAALKRDGTTDAVRDRMVDFATFNELIGLEPQRRRETELQDMAERLVAGSGYGGKARRAKTGS